MANALVQTFGLLMLRIIGIPTALIYSIYYLHIWTYLAIVLVLVGLLLVREKDEKRRWKARYGES